MPQDERSSENCLHCEINDVLQERVAEQEKVNVSAFTAHLEEESTWYYVIDCSRCKAVVPFKHAPEGEPIVRFPAMNVRCLHCRTDHTYAADLISRRKASSPAVIFDGDRPSSDEGDGVDREASRDRKDDRGEGDSALRVILDGEIVPISSSLRRNKILNVAVSGKTAAIFILSSCFFAAGWVLQLALDILYPGPLAVLNELRLSGHAGLLGSAFFLAVLPGLAFFLFGIGSLLVESFAFKARLKDVAFRFDSYIVSLARHATSTVALFLTETWQRKFSTQEPPGASGALRIELGREEPHGRKRAGRSGDLEPMS